MPATEEQYDTIIAPMLADVAKKCQELGMVMVARVEWQPGESGITQIGDNLWSAPQAVATYAAHCRGNVDRLCITLAKMPGADQSIVLSRFIPKSGDAL